MAIVCNKITIAFHILKEFSIFLPMNEIFENLLCAVDGSITTRNNVVSPSDGNGNQECPVCNVAGFQNQNQLAEHIDSHFNEKKNTVNNFDSIFKTVLAHYMATT